MLLFYRLIQIISGCLHTENANVQTAILDPFMQERLVGVDEECLHLCIDWKARRQNGKLPDGAGTMIHIILSIIRIICLG